MRSVFFTTFHAYTERKICSPLTKALNYAAPQRQTFPKRPRIPDCAANCCSHNDRSERDWEMAAQMGVMTRRVSSGDGGRREGLQSPSPPPSVSTIMANLNRMRNETQKAGKEAGGHARQAGEATNFIPRTRGMISFPNDVKRDIHRQFHKKEAGGRTPLLHCFLLCGVRSSLISN